MSGHPNASPDGRQRQTLPNLSRLQLQAVSSPAVLKGTEELMQFFKKTRMQQQPAVSTNHDLLKHTRLLTSAHVKPERIREHACIQTDNQEEPESDKRYAALQEIIESMAIELQVKGSQIVRLTEECGRLTHENTRLRKGALLSDTVERPNTVSPGDTLCEHVSCIFEANLYIDN